MNFKELNNFNKVDESLSPELIAETSLAKLENMILTKASEGLKPIKRGGYVPLLTVETPDNIVSLHDVKDSAGTNLLLASCGTLLEKYNTGTDNWDSLKTITPGKTRISPYGKDIVVTNDNDAPFILRGVDFATVESLQITTPDVSSITSSHKSGGNLTASMRYFYLLVYITDDGQLSPPSLPFTHYLDSNNLSTDDTNKQIRFDSLPVSSDVRVTARKIYRTKGVDTDAVGQFVFYLLRDLNNTDTYIEDSLADTELTIEDLIYINVPQTAKFNCINYERLFLASGSIIEKNFFPPAHSGVATSPPGGWTNGLGTSFAWTSAPYPNIGLFADTDYIWGFTFVDSLGMESDIMLTQVYNSGGTDPTIQIAVILSNIPMTGFDPAHSTGFAPDGLILGMNIYRSKQGDLTKFYRVATKVRIDLTSYTDEKDDDSLGVEFNQSANSYPNALFVSEVGQIASITIKRMIFPDDGDLITGIFDDEDGVMIFKENSICKVFTSNVPEAWVLRKLVSDSGAEKDTIIKQDKRYYYRANNRIYVYDGSGEPKPISDTFKSSIEAITSFNSITYITSKNWLVIGVTASSNYLYIYDELVNTWYKFSITNNGALIEKKHGTYAKDLIIGDGKFVIRYDDSLTVDQEGGDEAVITSLLRTKTLVSSINLYRLRFLLVNMNLVVGSLTYLIVNPDNSEQKTITETKTVSVGTIKKYLDQLTGLLQIANKFYIEISGDSLKELYALRVEYKALRRGRAVAK